VDKCCNARKNPFCFHFQLAVFNYKNSILFSSVCFKDLCGKSKSKTVFTVENKNKMKIRCHFLWLKVKTRRNRNMKYFVHDVYNGMTTLIQYNSYNLMRCACIWAPDYCVWQCLPYNFMIICIWKKLEVKLRTPFLGFLSTLYYEYRSLFYLLKYFNFHKKVSIDSK